MRLFLKIFLFLGLTFGYSQSYKPLLDTTNQWNFTSCNFGCITDAYFTNGDTLVNGLNYKILDGFHYLSRTFLLREEIANKKVFLRKINTNSSFEKLLYDFSLQEGETFIMNNPLSPFPSSGGEFVLDSIRMKPLQNNINFKHFYFSPVVTNSVSNYNVVWIEGLGSKSLINAPGGYVDINGVGELTCFYKNQDLVYSQLQPNQTCTYLELKTENHKSLFDEIKIYTTSEKNNFAFSNSDLISKIEIYDIFGKNLHYSIANYNSSNSIILSNQPKGLYFVLVYDSDSRKKNFKIIVN